MTIADVYALDDEQLSDLFGAVVFEIARRAELTEAEAMYSLARNYWEEDDGDGA